MRWTCSTPSRCTKKSRAGTNRSTTSPASTSSPPPPKTTSPASSITLACRSESFPSARRAIRRSFADLHNLLRRVQMADLWYRLVDGQSEGPHTFSDLQRMAASGEITPQDRLCEDGQNWIPAEQVAGLTFGAGRGSAGAALQPLPYLSSGGPTNAVVTAR